MCPLFDVVHPVFPLPTTESPTLQGALKNGFGEAVVACDMPEPLKFDNYQKRFLWTHSEVDLVPHPVAGLVLEVGDAEKFPYAFGFESLDFRVSKQGPCFTAVYEDGGDKRLVELELAREADGVENPGTV